ncbi:fumarylacetoacetate hydrolase family protein [Alcaligenaceae bacterium CGII-47]|nr:fumarylacetoacetate hydrolase family protein [Alcaligenaceae bacterium CGII-47]
MVWLKPGAAVYGVVLNDRRSLDKFGEAVDQPPYGAAPRAPVLYLKPENTWAKSGAHVVVPQGVPELEIGATIGLVLGEDVARLTEARAMNVIAGVLLAADLSVPHASYYRPAIAQKCFDGALPVTALNFPAQDMAAYTALSLSTFVNDAPVAQRNLGDLIRTVPQLLVAVTEFMALRAGDVLLVGVEYEAVRAPAGAAVRVEAHGHGALEFTLEHA